MLQNPQQTQNNANQSNQLQEIVKINDYIINKSKPLGQGQQAIVYKGFKESNRKEKLAIKQFDMKIFQNINQYQGTTKKMFKQEITILKSVQSKYLIDLKDFFRTANNIYLIFRYADGGDLLNKLNQQPNKILPEQQAMKYFVQILEGYKALKNNNIIHRDIKPANILLDKDTAVLADFGLGKVLQINGEIKQEITAQGTPYYRAPQLLIENFDNPEKKVAATNKIDMWAFGIILFEMLNGKRPWYGESIHNLRSNIQKEPIKFLVPIKDNIKDLIIKILQYDEEKRISWEELFNHPAVKEYSYVLNDQEQNNQQQNEMEIEN